MYDTAVTWLEIMHANGTGTNLPIQNAGTVDDTAIGDAFSAQNHNYCEQDTFHTYSQSR